MVYERVRGWMSEQSLPVLCAVLILASDEVILGRQHFDVYNATVEGIRRNGDVNF